MYIQTEKTENSLILTLDSEDFGMKMLREIKENCLDDFDDFSSDNVMYEFFEEFIANSEWEWIQPEEIGALTDAPILGIRDEDDRVIEAYGFMNYAIESLLDVLYSGKAVLQKG